MVIKSNIKCTVLLLVLVMLMANMSCKKDILPTAGSGKMNDVNNKNNNKDTIKGKVVDSSHALMVYDYSTGGIYKGILCGKHSGNFEIRLCNGNSDVKAIVRYNNTVDTLYTQDLLGWQSGSSVHANFSNLSNTKISLYVSITIGSNGNTNINLVPKNLTDNTDTILYASAIKELSSLYVSTYEGTFTNNDTVQVMPIGKFNFVLRGNELTGLMFTNTSDSVAKLTGNNGNGTWQVIGGTNNGKFVYGIPSSYMSGTLYDNNNVSLGSFQTQKTN